MRVSIVAPQSIALVNGGVKTQIHQTAKYLPDHGIELHYFSPWEDLSPTDVDLVHVFTANAGALEITNRLKDFDIPYVVSPVVFSNHKPDYIKRAIKVESLSKRIVSGVWTDYSIVAKVCSGAERVLPNTDEELGLLRDGFGIPDRKLEVVPNGVEKRFSNADPTLFQTTYGLKNVVLFVGNLGAPRKNALGLINAVAGTDIETVLIGKIYDNDYGRQCQNIAEKHSNIHVLGNLDHGSPMLESAYAAASVFALPSYFETPGIAAMEAALAGCRIVLTPFGGTKSYFGDMAIYPDPKSPESIRNTIQQALAEQAESGLKDHIERQFLWERVAEKTAAAYRKVLNG